jgi:hypothetical protein
MSYESVREQLIRAKAAARDGTQDFESLIEALEQLTQALESDLTQIKVALGHMAGLLEDVR